MERPRDKIPSCPPSETPLIPHQYQGRRAQMNRLLRVPQHHHSAARGRMGHEERGLNGTIIGKHGQIFYKWALMGKSSLCIYTYIMYIYIYTWYVYIYIYIHMFCTYIYTHMYIYIFIHVHYVCNYILCIYIYICMIKWWISVETSNCKGNSPFTLMISQRTKPPFS